MSPPEGNCNIKKRISCTTVYHCLPSGRKVYPSKMYLLRRIFTIFVCQQVWIQHAVFRIQILPVRKPWFLMFCDFFMTFYLWRMMQMCLQKVISKKYFLLAFWRSQTKRTGSKAGFRSISQRYRSADWIRTKMSRIRNTAIMYCTFILKKGQSKD